MSMDSFERPSPIALLTIIVLGLLGAGVLVVYGCTALARTGVRSSGPGVRIRSLAAFAAAAAAAVYVSGAAHLMLLDESGRDEACKHAVGVSRAMNVDGYHPTYIPLHLDCHVAGEGTYSAGVPAYVNPAVLVLVLLAVVFTIAAVLEPVRWARFHATRKESEIR